MKCFNYWSKTIKKQICVVSYHILDQVFYILCLSMLVPEALCDLAICKLSHCSATVAGGLDMILLCEKVTKGKHLSEYILFTNKTFLS